jgi:phage terminase Nu1 subunit (DNA packaging protein)
MGENTYIIRHPSVTVEAAAALTNVDVDTINEWARRGVIHIEARGDMFVVQLEEVKKAAALRKRESRRGTLRDRLKDAEGEERSADVVNIADLQELTRERNKR